MMRTDSNKQINILIPDAESHLTMYVINCLAQVDDLQIYVLSRSKNNPIKFSRFVKKFVHNSNPNDEAWIKTIDVLVETYKIDVIMPIFETAYEALIRNQEDLSSRSALPLLPKLSDFKTAVNKWDLYNHCFKLDIPIPKSVLTSGSNTNFDALEFPVICKPTEGFGGGKGIKKLGDQEALIHHLSVVAQETVLIQEYIEGYDIDCSVLCQDGQILAYTIQKGTLKGSTAFSPQLAYQFFDEPEFLVTIEKLMSSLNWNGIAHIDARFNLKNKAFYIIEVNARYWVSLEASLLAGVNFPWRYVCASLKREIPNSSAGSKHLLSLKGLVWKIKKRPMTLFRLRYIWSCSPLRFALKDPLPVMIKFISRTKNKLLSRFKS